MPAVSSTSSARRRTSQSGTLCALRCPSRIVWRFLGSAHARGAAGQIPTADCAPAQPATRSSTPVQSGKTASEMAKKNNHLECIKLLEFPEIEGLENLLRSFELLCELPDAAKWCHSKGARCVADLQEEDFARKFVEHLDVTKILTGKDAQ